MESSGRTVELSPEEEARALRLHESSVVALAHDHLFGADDLRAARRGGVTAKVVKLTVDGLEWDEHWRRVSVARCEGYAKRALVAMDAVYRLVETSGGEAVIVRNTADILAAKRDGKTGLILGLEGPRPLEGSVEVLRALYRLGLREMQLTWAVPNQLITDGMINDLGRRVIREMNELGVLIDLSHLADGAFHQVLEMSECPVVMSHTACHAVSGTQDTMTDEKIEALAAAGGVAALHFVSGDYIKPRRGTSVATLDDLIDHVDHIRSLVGIEYVALGGDYFPKAEEDDWRWVTEIEDISLIPNVTRGLVGRGYSDEEIEKVLGANLLRLYGKVWRE